MAVRTRRITALRRACWPSVQTSGTWRMVPRGAKGGSLCWTIRRVNPTKTCSAWEAARSCLTPQTVSTTSPHAVRTSTWCRSSSSEPGAAFTGELVLLHPRETVREGEKTTNARLHADKESQYEFAPGCSLIFPKAHAPFLFNRPEGLPIHLFVISCPIHAAQRYQ